jgi:hypothetical protein
MTEPTTTDWRALCADLLEALEIELDELHFTNRLCKRARAALAQPEPSNRLRYCDVHGQQPEPQGPTNERLTWLWNHLQVSRRQLMALRGENCLDDTDYQQFARSVLKQWGRPAIEPVPVSERLPGPEDCDAEGRCWTGFNDFIDETGDRPVPYPASWELRWILNEDTHWLPRWALPVPGVEGADA